jgi:HSP20 family protein
MSEQIQRRPGLRGRGGGRRDPFAGLEAIQARLNRMVGDAITGYRGHHPLWHSDIDVETTEDGWVLEVPLPGMAPEEVAVDVNDHELTIRAAHEGGGSGVHARRSRYSDFSYRLTMPSDVDTEAIDAVMQHGLLTVTLPRGRVSHRRRISVGRQIEQAPAESVPPDETGTGQVEPLPEA